MLETSISVAGIFRGVLGLFALILISWAMSSNRKAIDWKLVATGILMQIVFAVLVFYVPFIKQFFEFFARAFTKVTSFTMEGSKMLFEGLLNTESLGFLFAFQVLPTIVFFSALTSLLYYLKILQLMVRAIAWIMNRTMRLSGAESLSAAANIFVGQTEAPLVVKPYIERMTRSEILCLMSGGMATIAGGVLASYIALLGGTDPEMQVLFARHLLTASILSAPAALVISKMLVPETEEVEREMHVNEERIGTNALEAITNGTSEGLKLAINVGAMLLVFTAFVAMFNYILSDFIGERSGLNQIIENSTGGKYKAFNLQLIMGYVFAPLGWLCGVSASDLLVAGQLLGEKTILNEFFAYASFSQMKAAGLFSDTKSIIVVTYALCGFSNIASIGIQIGGISTIAPNQRTTLSQLGVRALIAGTIACLMTATIAGMFYS
ncbi:MAG: NupC/NupG family nucleoside CNT transporter [Flavobacteriales bacterium]|nr:NupC/NupG family nucleoside CNT transporter [Flavobacteriales bacterium]